MLSDRKKIILKAIIEEYVTTNEPIGSKSLTDKPNLDYSSATIRNEMQALEEEGYLKKTHTSSGRVPSDEGYRFYLDSLMIRNESVREYYKYVDEILDNDMQSKEDSIKHVAELLANMTGYYVSFIGNSSDTAKVLRLEIVPLEDDEAVLLIVTSSGLVQHQKIYIPKGYNIDDLMRIINMFDTAMYGHSIYEIRDILSKEASKPRIRQMVDFRDDILNFMIKAFERFLHGNTYDAGLSKLLELEEFKDYQKVQRLIRALDSNSIDELLDDPSTGTKVFVSSRDLNENFTDISVVKVPYTINEAEFGNIILVGPTRMKYSATIPMMEYIANSMHKLNKR